MAGVTTALRTGLVDNFYSPYEVFNGTVDWKEDFLSGGRTIVDAALANETDPYGHFFSTATNATGEWLVSHDAVVADTQLPTIQSAANGIVKCTTDATSGERISFQKTGAGFIMSVGKPMFFKARMKFTNTTQDAFWGLAVTGATDPHASRPAGFVAFTLTAAAGIEFATGDAGSATASAALTTATSIVADTYFVSGFYWDGVDSVDFYIDGSRKATTTLTLPTTLVLSPVFCVESNGAAEAMFVDYVLVSTPRT